MNTKLELNSFGDQQFMQKSMRNIFFEDQNDRNSHVAMYGLHDVTGCLSEFRFLSTLA